MGVSDYSSFDSVFVGALSFALVNKIDLDDAIKFADTAASISLSKIGEVSSIPDVLTVLENSGLKEKFGVDDVKKVEVAPEVIEPIQAENVENNIKTPDESLNNYQDIAFKSSLDNTNKDVPSNEEKHETNIFDNL